MAANMQPVFSGKDEDIKEFKIDFIGDDPGGMNQPWGLIVVGALGTHFRYARCECIIPLVSLVHDLRQKGQNVKLRLSEGASYVLKFEVEYTQYLKRHGFIDKGGKQDVIGGN